MCSNIGSGPFSFSAVMVAQIWYTPLARQNNDLLRFFLVTKYAVQQSIMKQIQLITLLAQLKGRVKRDY